MRKVAFQKNESRQYQGKTYYKYQVTIPEGIVRAAGFHGVTNVRIVPDVKAGIIKIVPVSDPIKE